MRIGILGPLYVREAEIHGARPRYPVGPVTGSRPPPRAGILPLFDVRVRLQRVRARERIWSSMDGQRALGRS